MTTDTSPSSHTPLEQVVNGAKLLGDFTVVPGSSLLVDGKIVEGGAHAILGFVAARAIGPFGWFLVAANSYSKSSSGSGLYEHLSELLSGKKGKRTTADASPAASSEAA